MKTIKLTILGLAGAAIIAAGAPPIEIGQKGRVFSKDVVEAEVGQAIIFINDDQVPHNIYTEVGGQKIDKGLSRPGQNAELVFDKAGEYTVSCVIHPKMKMTVKVN